MKVLCLAEALNRALAEEMAADSRIVLLGQDVGVSGGVFRVTKGLLSRFGSVRVFDTPVSESGMIGVAVGMCIAGMRPICEIQFDAFSYPALHQVISHVSRYCWRTRGATPMPMVIRIPCGGGVKAPELHEDSPEAYFCHTPGLRVVIPSTVVDAKGLLSAAIHNPDPVIFLEPKRLYRSLKGELPTEAIPVPLDKVRTVREGRDVTVFAWGAMVEVAGQAVDALETEGVSCHLCDVRTLSPLDEDGIVDACQASGRALIVQEGPRRCSVASEISATIAERALFCLREPIVRVSGFDVPYPYWSAEHHYLPSVARVRAAAMALLRN